MGAVPRPRTPEETPPSEEQCWIEFWDAIADAIAEARIRQARELA